jgi:hypothetical protein
LEFSPCLVGAAALICSQAQIHQQLRGGCADQLAERPNGSSFGLAEIEMAACTELSVSHIARLCRFDEVRGCASARRPPARRVRPPLPRVAPELCHVVPPAHRLFLAPSAPPRRAQVDLLRCESLLRGYFERHFLQPKRNTAAEQALADEAAEGGVCAREEMHDVQISVSLSGMAVYDAAGGAAASEWLKCAEGAAGKLPLSPDRGSPDSVETLLEMTSFTPVQFATLDALSEELDDGELTAAGCCS